MSKRIGRRCNENYPDNSLDRILDLVNIEGEAMKRYEYKITAISQYEAVARDPAGITREEKALQAAGDEGWELCAIHVLSADDRSLYFKREVRHERSSRGIRRGTGKGSSEE